MKKEYIYAGISIVLWSTIATITKLLLGSFDSMQIMLVSSAVSFLLLLGITIGSGALKEIKAYTLKDHVHIFLIGIVGIFFYHLFLFMGIDKMDASQAFIINYLWPVMTVLFACIILKEKMTVRKGFAIALSFAGVVVVTANGNFLSIDKNTALGAVYCVLAAISYGLFSVLNKKKSYNSYVSMMMYYFYTFIISLIYMIFLGNRFTLSAVEMVGMLWIGVFTTAIAFTTWALALKAGDTAKISNLAYITPFLSMVWTTLILKEEFNISSLLGLLLIVMGIFIQIKNKKIKQKNGG